MYKGSDKHKEAIKAWAKANPEKRAATRAKYYAKCKERESLRNKTDPIRKGMRLEAVRRWQAANQDKLKKYRSSESRKLTTKVHGHKRRLVENSGDLTGDEWISVVEAFNGCCAFCLEPSDKLTLDHFRPISKEGMHTLENVVPACPSCNFKKNQSLLFDFIPRGVGVITPQVGL